MSFSDPGDCFGDILENIGHIEGFLKDMGPVELVDDQRTVFACHYALLVISEAAKRLGPQAEALCPGIPWRDIRGIGNQLRHAYDNLNSMMIWKVYQDDLPMLKVAITAALARMKASPLRRLLKTNLPWSLPPYSRSEVQNSRRPRATRSVTSSSSVA